MFIGRASGPKDLNGGGVIALGAVWQRPGVDADRGQALVRRVIAERGWGGPEESFIYQVEDVVMLSGDARAATEALLSAAYHSGAHVLVVPSLGHIPDHGFITRGVVSAIVAVAEDEVLAARWLIDPVLPDDDPGLRCDPGSCPAFGATHSRSGLR